MSGENLTKAGTPLPSDCRVTGVRFIPHWLRKAHRLVKQAYENRKLEKAARLKAKNDHTDSQTPAVQDHAPFIPPLKFEAATTEGLVAPPDTPTDPDTIPRTRFLKYRERPTSKGRQSSASHSPQEPT